MPKAVEDTTPTTPVESAASEQTQDTTPVSSPGEDNSATATDANQESAQSSGADAEQGAKNGDEASSENKLLDIVRNVVNGSDTSEAEPEEGSPPAEEDEGQSQAADNAEGSDQDSDGKLADEDLDEDGKPLPFHKHKRWQEVKSQRDEYRKQAEAFKPDAEQYQKITNFMTERNLTPDEVGQGFQVMDLIKNNPEAALTYLEGAVGVLRQSLGKDIPDDLADAVDRGEISEQHARELSEARALSRNAQEANQATQRRFQETQQRQAMTQVGQAMASAVSGWEQQVRKTDPDFSKKADLIAAYAKSLRADAIANGNMNTPDDAVRIAQEAYEAANKQLSSLIPKKKATDPTPSSSVSSKSAAPAAPKSLLEAARLGAQMPTG